MLYEVIIFIYLFLLYLFQSLTLNVLSASFFSLSRILEKRHNSESNQGLSLGRIVMYLKGIQRLIKPRNRSVHFSQAVLTEPSLSQLQS